MILTDTLSTAAAPPSDHGTEQAPQGRQVSRAMRALLYVLAGLTFIAGTQLIVLAEHTDVFFAWTITAPLTATLIGSGFWAASAVVFWCVRQPDWARAGMVVPTIAVVATMLLLATL